MLHRSFEGVLRKFHGCFKNVSSVFLGNFKKVSRVFQEYINEILFEILSQLREQKEALLKLKLFFKMPQQIFLLRSESCCLKPLERVEKLLLIAPDKI